MLFSCKFHCLYSFASVIPWSGNCRPCTPGKRETLLIFRLIFFSSTLNLSFSVGSSLLAKIVAACHFEGQSPAWIATGCFFVSTIWYSLYHCFQLSRRYFYSIDTNPLTFRAVNTWKEITITFFSTQNAVFCRVKLEGVCFHSERTLLR